MSTHSHCNKMIDGLQQKNERLEGELKEVDAAAELYRKMCQKQIDDAKELNDLLQAQLKTVTEDAVRLRKTLQRQADAICDSPDEREALAADRDPGVWTKEEIEAAKRRSERLTKEIGWGERKGHAED